MIADARALVSLAEGLRDWAPERRVEEARSRGPPSRAAASAVLVHAMSLVDLGEEVARSAPRSQAGPRMLVLLDDVPAVPSFLPDDADSDVATVGVARAAIEQGLRGAAARAPLTRLILDLVECMQDAILAIDRDRTVTYLNPSGVALLQSLTNRTGPFVGEPLAKAFPPATSPTLRPAIERALRDADATRVEDPERHRGLVLDVAVFPNPDGATLLLRDVTARRDIEAELVEARLSLARAARREAALDDEAVP